MRQNLEWNMANLLFKKEKLKQENSSLLKKANRDDVKGRENELLLPSELNQLKMVNERELNVFARLSRLLSLWEVFQMA
ncbi:ANL_collapsed_G0058480.mRNA.1.CDS.1 [Saccharomyces cerevisiae]|nr:ANL_collapsed_G0058480.mRNA.1.CDS.1 [Saccharomyces cerevisiae]